MNEYVIETKQLTKRYRGQEAVSRVELHVKKGAVYGLIGRNGAGKTTIMKMLTGMSNPTEGEIHLFGREHGDRDGGWLRIGSLIEQPGVYADRTAFQNMKLKALAMGVYRKENVLDILELVGLSNTGRKKVKAFSMGMQQRLGIALALIGTPDLLILDEPINGLDPMGVVEMRNLIGRLSRERNMTILISSHILEEVHKVATDYGIIDHGKLLRELSAEELGRECEKKVEITTPKPELAAVELEGIGIRKYTVADPQTIYVYEGLDSLTEMNRILAQKNVPVLEIKLRNDSLEDFFMKAVESGRERKC